MHTSFRCRWRPAPRSPGHVCVLIERWDEWEWGGGRMSEMWQKIWRVGWWVWWEKWYIGCISCPLCPNILRGGLRTGSTECARLCTVPWLDIRPRWSAPRGRPHRWACIRYRSTQARRALHRVRGEGGWEGKGVRKGWERRAEGWVAGWDGRGGCRGWGGGWRGVNGWRGSRVSNSCMLKANAPREATVFTILGYWLWLVGWVSESVSVCLDAVFQVSEIVVCKIARNTLLMLLWQICFIVG